MSRLLAFACALSLSLVVFSPAARAQDADAKPQPAPQQTDPAPDVTLPSPMSFAPIANPDRVQVERWQPASELHSSLKDWYVVAAGAGVGLASAIAQPQPAHAKGGVLFDEWARNNLRIGNLQRRYQFRDASDVGLSLATTWPFFVDALITAWWYRGNSDVARDMTRVDFETLAVLAGIQGVANTAVSRERPYGRDCGSADLPADSIDCQGSNRYRSFFSGHTSTSFASAALICMHHLKLKLLGPVGDIASCVGGEMVAATVSTFRMVGDMHYATDVLTGMFVGTALGIGIPLLHYRTEPKKPDEANVSIVPIGTGIGLGGTF